MTKINQWVALGALGVLAVLAGGWFLLVSPTRAEAAALRVQAEEQAVANDRVKTQVQVLQAQADALPQQRARLAEVAARIPPEARLPELIRALTDAAEDGDVEFVSLVPGAPAPVAAATLDATTGLDGAAADGTAEGTAGGTAGASAATAGTLQALPVTLNVVGGYYQVERYLAALEELPRALRVSGLTITRGANPVAAETAEAAEDGRSLAAVITGTVFLAADQEPVPSGTALTSEPAAEDGGADTTQSGEDR